jgi:hypothetical protein
MNAISGEVNKTTAPHPVNPEDSIRLPEGDIYRFDGHEGLACPYHLKKSFDVGVDEIVPGERREDEEMYTLNIYLKNYSPCLFANFYLNIRMTDRDGEVIDERSVLVEYVPSYSSNIIKDSIWLPIFVDPHGLTYEFEFEQIR